MSDLLYTSGIKPDKMNESNSTNNDFAIVDKNCKYLDTNSDLEKNVKFHVAVLLGGLGIIGNIFIIMLTLKYTVRKKIHHLIVNMALSDVLYCCFYTFHVFAQTYKIETSFPGSAWGNVICKGKSYLALVFYAISLVTLLVISIERFRATRQTLQIPRPLTIKRRLAVVSVCWLIPMIVFSYTIYLREYNQEKGKCSAKRLDEQQFLYMKIIKIAVCILRIAAVIVTLTLSFLTIKILAKPREIHTHIDINTRNVLARRIRATVTMVLASLLLYVCCWFPRMVFYFLLTLQKILPNKRSIVSYSAVCMDWSSFHFIIDRFLPLSNSVLSPCIYVIFLPDFREAAKRVLWRRRLMTSHLQGNGLNKHTAYNHTNQTAVGRAEKI